MSHATVLFLGGLGRSGTTLLERLLSELPGAVALGEVVHLWQRDLRDGERCGCGEPFLSCQFWTTVGEKAFGGWDHVDVDRVLQLQHQVDRTRFIPGLSIAAWAERHRADLDEYTSHYRRVYQAVQDLTGAQVVIDSSKHASLAYCLAHDPEIDLRVLHVVRDSRGVAYSWTKQIARPETDGEKDMATWSPGRTSALWAAHNTAFSALNRAHPSVPVMRMTYESVIAEPESALRSIAAFAGLSADLSSLDFVEGTTVQLTPGHSAAGNPMRFRSGPMTLRQDDAWRTALPTAQRHVVNLLTYPLMRAYGYPTTSRQAHLYSK